MRIPDSFRACTCFLCVKDGNRVIPGGTAFWALYPSNKMRGFPYLVTAKHCVEEAFKQFGGLYARVNVADERGSDLIGLSQEAWRFHPDPAVDVAVIPWPEPLAGYFAPGLDRGEFSNKLQANFIDLRSAAHDANTKASSIGIGNEVVVIGLFRLHHGTHRNIPIVRHGIISAMPEESLYDKEGRPYHAVLVEIQSIGGLSGSPVFVHIPKDQLLARHGLAMDRNRARSANPAGFLYLLGLVRGHFDETMAEWPEKVSGRVNTGIALVTPIHEVLDFLMKDEQMAKAREEAIRKERPAGTNAEK